MDPADRIILQPQVTLKNSICSAYVLKINSMSALEAVPLHHQTSRSENPVPQSQTHA